MRELIIEKDGRMFEASIEQGNLVQGEEFYTRQPDVAYDEVHIFSSRAEALARLEELKAAGGEIEHDA